MGSEHVRKSVSPPGHGTAAPERVHKYNVFNGPDKTGIILRWDGNGYEKDSCWIRASIDAVVNLDRNL